MACQLEMWQEAFRSIEDIHGLWALNKRMPKPGLRAQYFACLTDVFSKSGSHVYHAYSWFQLFSLSAKLNKNLSPDDRAQMASAVLLSTLSIEPYDRKGPEGFGERTKAERASRIVDILGFNHDPARSAEDMLSRTNLLAELTVRRKGRGGRAELARVSRERAHGQRETRAVACIAALHTQNALALAP